MFIIRINIEYRNNRGLTGERVFVAVQTSSVPQRGCESLILSVISTSCLNRRFISFQNIFSMFVSCTFVLKYSFNTVFINICYNMLQCQKHSAKNYKLFCLVEDRYFPPPWYIHLLYFFSKKYIFSSAEKSELIQ